MLLPRCKLPRITQRQVPQKILVLPLNTSEMNLLRGNRCKYLWNVCLMQNTPGGPPSLFPKWNYTDAAGPQRCPQLVVQGHGMPCPSSLGVRRLDAAFGLG